MSTGVNAVYLNGTFPDTVAAYIDSAKFSVDIAQYDYLSSSSNRVAKIATAANNAALRGVIVRWIYNGGSPNSGLTLLNASVHTLASPTTTNFGLMHHKFVVIDANAADTSQPWVVTGSYDWSSQQTTTDYNNLLLLQSKDVALAFYEEFNKMWGDTSALPNAATSAFGPQKTPSPQHMFNVNGTVVEVYFSPEDATATRMKSIIAGADNELFFGIYTFTDNTIANAIKNKYNSGVAVKGIMDSYSQTYSPYSTLTPVLGNNMLLYAGSGIYHSKILLVDALHPASDPTVFTGSFNWTYSAQTSNDENTVIVHDAVIANQYYQSLCQDFASNGGAACTSLMPLDLISFKCFAQDNAVRLEWVAVNNDVADGYFVVEKSNDGENFYALARINESHTQQYSFTDNDWNESNTYYRIHLVNKDAANTYSNIILVKAKTNLELSVYPNPATDKLIVKFHGASRQIVSLKLTDLAGKLLQQQTINAGEAYTSFTISSFAKDMYLLWADGKPVKKFLKQ